MKIRICGMLPILLWAGMAYGWNEQVFDVTPDNVKNVTFVSVSHIVAPARNVQQIRIAGLLGGCSWVYLDSSKDVALFTGLWTAYIKKKPFTLRYDLDQRSPWGDRAGCAITSITFDPV